MSKKHSIVLGPQNDLLNPMKDRKKAMALFSSSDEETEAQGGYPWLTQSQWVVFFSIFKNLIFLIGWGAVSDSMSDYNSPIRD